MLKGFIKTTSIALSAMLLFTSMQLDTQASGVSSVLPSGGINIALSQGATQNVAQTTGTTKKLETIVELSEVEARQLDTETALAKEVAEESLENLVIVQTNGYVNIRNTPGKKGQVVGKFYDNAAGTILSEQDGWYEIQSGNVTGFVRADLCVVGEEAIELAKEVGTRIAIVECDRLLIREEADAEGEVLGMVALHDELVVTEETEDWVKVDIEEGFGWVSREYVKVYTEFIHAESKEEEAARLAKEAEERENARIAAAERTISTVAVTDDNEMGIAVAEYAVQFIGNPYVWGGTSLTNGADCSGFVMKVYENFGVSLPHSSAADRKQGYAVDGLENAQPGDLICYSGHVALYIGDGQIVHAANSKKGIIVSQADYRKILAIRRIF
ncbi:MAG: C40 family peptidase [Lachnospiraceae bacterium]|nr:C40 family peptidase [Lachnospiraceae bacterium]MBQ7777089.1 C40 family peptidase [Lachnospiraceae bacterium]